MSYYDDDDDPRGREDDDGSDEEEDPRGGSGEGEGLPQTVADLANASAPSASRGIRACMRCGILKTVDQFISDGCENCPFLEMVRICFACCVRCVWGSFGARDGGGGEGESGTYGMRDALSLRPVSPLRRRRWGGWVNQSSQRDS